MREASTNSRPSFTVPSGSCDAISTFSSTIPGRAEPPVLLPRRHPAAVPTGLRRARDRADGAVQPTYYAPTTASPSMCWVSSALACRAVRAASRRTFLTASWTISTSSVRAIRLDLFARRDWPLSDIDAYVRRMAARRPARLAHPVLHTRHPRSRSAAVPRRPARPLRDRPLGYMLESDGLTPADFDRLLNLLKQGNCWIKLSGPYRIAKDKPFPLWRRWSGAGRGPP